MGKRNRPYNFRKTNTSKSYYYVSDEMKKISAQMNAEIAELFDMGKRNNFKCNKNKKVMKTKEEMRKLKKKVRSNVNQSVVIDSQLKKKKLVVNVGQSVNNEINKPEDQVQASVFHEDDVALRRKVSIKRTKEKQRNNSNCVDRKSEKKRDKRLKKLKLNVDQSVKTKDVKQEKIDSQNPIKQQDFVEDAHMEWKHELNVSQFLQIADNKPKDEVQDADVHQVGKRKKSVMQEYNNQEKIERAEVFYQEDPIADADLYQEEPVKDEHVECTEIKKNEDQKQGDPVGQKMHSAKITADLESRVQECFSRIEDQIKRVEECRDRLVSLEGHYEINIRKVAVPEKPKAEVPIKSIINRMWTFFKISY